MAAEGLRPTFSVMDRSDRKLPLIEAGYTLFLSDGGESFGAVRRVSMEGSEPALEVNVEGAGDFQVALDAVEKVASTRVVLRFDRLAPAMQEAIRHAVDVEDYPPPGEVELVTSDNDNLDEDDASRYDAPPLQSAPGEMPGRDAGSYGAPPSISGRRR
jgi:hypothetical protein